jgi:3-phosphoshikimate 1-carboxyvinyltransferase
VQVEPASEIRGDVAVPGVKGISQRAVLLGAVGDGESVIRGFGRAADTDSAIEAVRAMGVHVVDEDVDVVRIHGVGLRGLRAPEEPIDCGNAGTVMRLLTGLLAGQDGAFELVGDESLSARPQERVAEPLRQMGAWIETTDGHAPVRIEGSALAPIRYELPVASAQVKTAVLFAGLYAHGGPTTVVEPLPSRDHTERLLPALGVRVERGAHDVSVWPAERLRPLDLDIPGDFSAAAPFVVAAALVPGSQLRIHGVNVNPTRIGLLDVLERMGVRISLFNRRHSGGELVADLEVRSPERQLSAAEIGRDEVPRLVDELPLFALAAGLARGVSVVRGAEELRVKESDRIETVTEALRGIGIRIEAQPDGFRIRGVPIRPAGGRIDAHGDHRIAMLGAVAGLVSRDGVEVGDAETVAISFPGFFELLDSVTRR